MSTYKPTREDARRALEDAEGHMSVSESTLESLKETFKSLDDIDAEDSEYYHVYQEASSLI